MMRYSWLAACSLLALTASSSADAQSLPMVPEVDHAAAISALRDALLGGQSPAGEYKSADGNNLFQLAQWPNWGNWNNWNNWRNWQNWGNWGNWGNY